MIKIIHNAGFFSCCSVKLTKIVDFINSNKRLPDNVDSSKLFRLYKKQAPEGIMPMSIHKLGNSSVATVPTLLDLVLKGNIENQEVKKGDIVILASVGAGMNVNAVVYKY